MTSDGLPHCEMAACMVAGEHPNLIPVLGKVVHHPDAVTGLVMELIDPAFVNLAGPPSLESCTRDVYAPDVRFDTTSALTLAHGIASAMRHLHAQGIMHGDLYGHNILYRGDGQALIGDFGAASFHEGEQDELGLALQRIEVRAFGCLLEELVQRCEATDADLVMPKLQALCAACLNDAAGERPLFAEIEARLAESLAA